MRSGQMPVSAKGWASLALGAAMAAVLLTLVGIPRAEAAFPGSNGKIVFHSARSIVVGDPSTTDNEIFSINPNGTGLAQLTVNAVQDFNPAWSPNGLEIAFERRDGDDDIYKMAADGSNERFLTNNTLPDDTGAAWSPNGNRIAFVSDRNANGDDEIYTISSSNGSNIVRLTRNSENDLRPAWSPNGRRIAFTSFRTNNYEIFWMKPEPEGKDNRPVNVSKNATAHDSDPNWSPTGTRISFTSRRGISSDFEIYSMAASGSQLNPLTENLANDLSPAWSPDGTKVAFHSDRDGNGEIYVMNPDGTNPQNLTMSMANDNEPDWQPGP